MKGNDSFISAQEIDVLCQRLMSNYQRSARLIGIMSLTYQAAAQKADTFQRLLNHSQVQL